MPPASMKEVADRYAALLGTVDQQWRETLSNAVASARGTVQRLPESSGAGPAVSVVAQPEIIITTTAAGTPAGRNFLWTFFITLSLVRSVASVRPL